MTRRSISCSEATEEWRCCWSRPKNQILQAEMTEHLKAEPGEETSGRRGYRNGTYERQLTTRVGTIELEVPRDREGTFFGGSLPAVSAVGEGTRLGVPCRWWFKAYRHAE